jgi:hypothetical protein
LDISYHELNGDLSGDESLPYNKVLRLEEIPADQWKADNANEIVIKV